MHRSLISHCQSCGLVIFNFKFNEYKAALSTREAMIFFANLNHNTSFITYNKLYLLNEY